MRKRAIQTHTKFTERRKNQKNRDRGIKKKREMNSSNASVANAIDELSHVKFCVYDHRNVYSCLICNLILVQHYCMCAMIKYNSKQSWFLVYVL